MKLHPDGTLEFEAGKAGGGPSEPVLYLRESQAVALLRRSLAMLVETEWCVPFGDVSPERCPSCAQHHEFGHADDCTAEALRLDIRAALGDEGGEG